jgi:hypothetical protein
MRMTSLLGCLLVILEEMAARKFPAFNVIRAQADHPAREIATCYWKTACEKLRGT